MGEKFPSKLKLEYSSVHLCKPRHQRHTGVDLDSGCFPFNKNHRFNFPEFSLVEWNTMISSQEFSVTCSLFLLTNRVFVLSKLSENERWYSNNIRDRSYEMAELLVNVEVYSEQDKSKSCNIPLVVDENKSHWWCGKRLKSWHTRHDSLFLFVCLFLCFPFSFFSYMSTWSRALRGIKTSDIGKTGNSIKECEFITCS